MYEIVLFDTLAVSPYIRRGNTQNIGTGHALSSFIRLPGGGWYNSYGGHKAPKDVQPVTKQGVFIGTNAQIVAQIDAWRAYLGLTRRLTARWFTGALRWQDAELVDVVTPTESRMRGGWADFQLNFETAAQHWLGVTYDEIDWTVGDSTFLISDGSAEVGVGSQSFVLSSASNTVTVNHRGSIDAVDITLRLAMTGSWQNVTIINETTGQQIIVERGSLETAPGLEINAGINSIYRTATPRGASLSRSLNTLTIDTTVSHSLTAGRPIRVVGSDEYDGEYYPSVTPSLNTATVPLPPTHRGYGVDAGTIIGLTDLIGSATFSDVARWMVMAKGENVLSVIFDPMPTTATLTAEFADHYA